MAMSNFNRQNPFMYLLETTSYKLADRCQDAIKALIIIGLQVIISIILYITLGILKSFSIWGLFSIIFPYLIIILQTIYSVRNTKIQQIDHLIYGDAYKDIDLNNEKLLADITQLNVFLGRTKIVIEFSRLFQIYYMIYIILEIIRLIAHLL